MEGGPSDETLRAALVVDPIEGHQQLLRLGMLVVMLLSQRRRLHVLLPSKLRRVHSIIF
jgi:hypothetical protein